jgi:hypothetical protein
VTVAEPVALLNILKLIDSTPLGKEIGMIEEYGVGVPRMTRVLPTVAVTYADPLAALALFSLYTASMVTFPVTPMASTSRHADSTLPIGIANWLPSAAVALTVVEFPMIWLDQIVVESTPKILLNPA